MYIIQVVLIQVLFKLSLHQHYLVLFPLAGDVQLLLQPVHLLPLQRNNLNQVFFPNIFLIHYFMVYMQRCDYMTYSRVTTGVKEGGGEIQGNR